MGTRRRAIEGPASIESATLKHVNDAQSLKLVDGDMSITDEIQILFAPGETEGHQVVRIHSRGETLYCLGDIYHHPNEFKLPQWMVSWADSVSDRKSRERITERAVKDNGVLIGTHIRHLGTLKPTAMGVEWAMSHKWTDCDR